MTLIQRIVLAAAAALPFVLFAACQRAPSQSSSSEKIAYPPTAKGDVVDDYFGTKVADPYRWMEDLDSPQVAAWIAAQNKVTFDYLAKLPDRDRFNKRI